ncbi:hypothetical protein [Pseudomonas sp.]|uniref:hypothetical protein n=1 Tax=Pseudomonas sp. TaxID=306 RepID=UPI00290BD9CA|nr:hypothetical protein [Pseudomonas sp.]MDU4254520.1 hypothetical protein [Pseudomonas sp.]
MATIDQKKADLEGAIRELSNWEDYDARREDGSGAQDRRHEERGESLRNRVDQLAREVQDLEKKQVEPS